MTTILTDKRLVHIGRRAELGARRRDDVPTASHPIGRGVAGSKPICQTPERRPALSGRPARFDRVVSDERLLAEIGCVHKANYACLRLAAGLQTTWLREGEQGRSLHGRAADADTGSSKPSAAAGRGVRPDPDPDAGSGVDVERDFTLAGSQPAAGRPLFVAFVLGAFSPQRRR
jgi:hypothetical protein